MKHPIFKALTILIPIVVQASGITAIGAGNNSPHGAFDNTSQTKEVDRSLDLKERQSVSKNFEAGLKQGRYCVIIGYSEKTNRDGVSVNSSDEAMSNGWNYHRAIGTKLLSGVNTINGLISALKNCPLDKGLILNTHGRGESEGSFCVSSKECVSPRSDAFDKISAALVGRSNVYFWACAIAKSAGGIGSIDNNFVNQLVNRVYQMTVEKYPKLEKTYKPRFTAYSNVMYAGSDTGSGFRAGGVGDPQFEGAGREVVFKPDTIRNRETTSQNRAFDEETRRVAPFNETISSEWFSGSSQDGTPDRLNELIRRLEVSRRAQIDSRKLPPRPFFFSFVVPIGGLSYLSMDDLRRVRDSAVKWPHLSPITVQEVNAAILAQEFRRLKEYPDSLIK